MPFQYSLHRIDAEGEEPKHFEYLAHPGPDPRKEIAEKLLGEIPLSACVLVYNRTFEKRVLKELGESLPGLRKRLNAVAEGMIDLMEPFRPACARRCWNIAGRTPCRVSDSWCPKSVPTKSFPVRLYEVACRY